MVCVAQMQCVQNVPVKRDYSFAVNYWYHYFSSASIDFLFRWVLCRNLPILFYVGAPKHVISSEIKSDTRHMFNVTENKCNEQKAIFYSRKHTTKRKNKFSYQKKNICANGNVVRCLDTMHILTGHAEKKRATKCNDYCCHLYWPIIGEFDIPTGTHFFTFISRCYNIWV